MGSEWGERPTGGADVSRLPGVGSKAVDRLRRALDANGQSFAGGEWA